MLSIVTVHLHTKSVFQVILVNIAKETKIKTNLAQTMILLLSVENQQFDAFLCQEDQFQKLYIWIEIIYSTKDLIEAEKPEENMKEMLTTMNNNLEEGQKDQQESTMKLNIHKKKGNK